VAGAMTTTRSARLRAVAVTLAVALTVGGCGGSADGAGERPRIDLRPARHFKRFTLFYLGPGYGRYPLTYDGRPELHRYYRGSDVTFSYGSCVSAPLTGRESSPEQEDSCTWPITISNYPICAKNPSLYGDSSKLGRLVQIRGVPAFAFIGADGGFSSIELYTGKTTVQIDGLTQAQMLDMARRLVPLNRPPHGRRLPMPTPGAVEGKLWSCESSKE
jgi:hypothetical protein